MKDLKKRTITAVILIAILSVVIFFGGAFINSILCLLTIGAAYELEKMYKKEEKWSFYSISNIVLAGVSFASLVLIYNFKAYEYILVFLLILLIVEGFLMIFTKNSTIVSLSQSLLTIFYSSIGFASISILRATDTGLFREGLFLIIYLFLICFSTDCFAYFFGSKFGKTKLCERISPKKSWEGSIAGTIFALIIPPIFASTTGVTEFLFPNLTLMWGTFAVVLLSFVLSVIDEIGDLFASKLKRFYGLKDYSQIFPGHGGVLDRFDSYIFVAVAMVAWLLMVY